MFRLKTTMKSICVYLGAKAGNQPELTKIVEEVGSIIAKQEVRLVYGGSSHGLMGVLAKSVLNSGGTVLGIIPKQLLEIEKPLESINELIVTENIQQRKLLMQQQADAFVVMPGGLGTLEEAFETWNAVKIGLINKPIGFLNFNQFFDKLFLFLSECTEKGFLHQKQLAIPVVDDNPEHLITSLVDILRIKDNEENDAIC